jgi:hypothetical protein
MLSCWAAAKEVIIDGWGGDVQLARNGAQRQGGCAVFSDLLPGCSADGLVQVGGGLAWSGSGHNFLFVNAVYLHC